MRYLHPVAASEKFIARGVYRFYEGDTLLPRRQSWSRHMLAGGGLLTRIDHEWEGITALAEVLSDSQAHIERVTIREWNTQPSSSYHVGRLDYIFFPTYVQAIRRIDSQNTEQAEIKFDTLDTFISLINFVVYWGVSYRELAKKENINRAVFITMLDIEDALGTLTSNVSPPQLIDQGSILWQNRLCHTKTYRQFGNTIVVDDNDIVLKAETEKYSHHLHQPHIVLTEYAHI